MHEYDITLKSILTRSGSGLLAQLTGLEVMRWHNVELPAVRQRRPDLLGETRDGVLVHIELQSTNHRAMARRMLEYAVFIHKKFARFPEQLVLYVGNAPMRMESRLTGPRLAFEYRLMDVREVESGPLLRSECLEDNVIAVLAHLGSDREAVRRILRRIAGSEPSGRGTALAELMILAGLRKLGTIIETEIEQMPILDDIMDHEVLGRERKRGIALGIAEGERKVVLRQLGKRFGPVPDWAAQRLSNLSPTELEKVEFRLLDAPSLEELFS